MNCSDVQNLLDGYIDGELDLVRNLEIEDHLQSCKVCAPIYKNRQTLQAQMQSGGLAYKAPPHLRKHIQASLRQAGQSGPRQRSMVFRWLAVAALLLMALITTWSLIRSSSTPSLNPLASSVLASHIRSLQANHLLDVTSSDQHTVKPWFDGKLDYSPIVIDLAPQGFPLIGGRLDYLDNQPVAALVYKNGNHTINLFTWPSTSASNERVTTVNLQGYHLLTWTQAGMVYWAVSDLEESKLQTFAQLLQQGVPTSFRSFSSKQNRKWIIPHEFSVM